MSESFSPLTTPHYPFEERLGWRQWVMPKLLHSKPIHRWYTFPHSFTSELVHGLIEEWGLGPEDRILDPFVGAGTTLLAAKEKGVPATGYDLSPLAVLATRTKIANYDVRRLEKAWRALKPGLNPSRWNGSTRTYPALVEKALPGRLLGAFEAVASAIAGLPCSEAERDFFRLALLATMPQYSRAVATGGWLKWVDRDADVVSLPSALGAKVTAMLADIQGVPSPHESAWLAAQADARRLPDPKATYSAVITSPPYPNRHDHTRVFGVELMFGFLDWEGNRRLRYQSFHSHPEARPARPEADGYMPSPSLLQALGRIKDKNKERRLLPMLEGYFLDMHLCLRELGRISREGARIAFVVGNAQYCGEPILVDELTAEIGEQAGLTCERILVARFRGNSAQQMGEYGRNPSRESIVVFRKGKGSSLPPVDSGYNELIRFR